MRPYKRSGVSSEFFLLRHYTLTAVLWAAVFGVMYPTATLQAADSITLESNERLITILSTNDIHGGVEPTDVGRAGKVQLAGGMAMLAGISNAIKKGISHKYGTNGGVITVDAGDQFQGTLISNFNEGELVFRTMNVVGYDAVVPGNHAYDFGPMGWLDDRVNSNNPDKNPRGALERIIKLARFPLVAANVYRKNSLVGKDGKSIDADASGFKESKVDWERAARPSFLKSYVLKTVAGVKVAMVGMDNYKTPVMTTGENVSDLYFRNERDTYLEIYDDLKDRVDVFVLVIHSGDSGNQKTMSKMVGEINSGRGPDKVNAVIAGHTHMINNARIGNVPMIQAGNGGVRLGRIDLVWDNDLKRLNSQKMRVNPGMKMLLGGCESTAKFCEVTVTALGNEYIRYEGVITRPSATVLKLIKLAKQDVAPLADRVLGEADSDIKRYRIFESSLANAITDTLLKISGAEVSLINTGGIRANIKKGKITYSDLFNVLPFANRGVVVGPMKIKTLMSLLKRAVKTCGAYSSLMQAGLRVVFERDCAKRAKDGVDEKAKLLRVETVGGTLLYGDSEGGIVVSERTTFDVATFDFLADGGSGYSDFKGVPKLSDFGIVREALTNQFLKEPIQLKYKRDNRWRETQTK